MDCCAAAMCEECWVGGGRANFSSHTQGAKGLQSLWRLRDSRNPCHERGPSKEAVVACSTALFNFSFFLFWGCRERPDFFLLRALPAADCDTELPLRSSVLSSELSRRSLAYPGPTEINLAWSVRPSIRPFPFNQICRANPL